MADEWPCASCTFVNKASISLCEMCTNARDTHNSPSSTADVLTDDDDAATDQLPDLIEQEPPQLRQLDVMTTKVRDVLNNSGGLKWIDAATVLELVAQNFPTDQVARRFAHEQMKNVIIKLIDMTVLIQGRDVSWYDLKEQWVETERTGGDARFVYKDNVEAFIQSLENCASICAMSVSEGSKELLSTIALLLDPCRQLYFDVVISRPPAYVGAGALPFSKDLFDSIVPALKQPGDVEVDHDSEPGEGTDFPSPWAYQLYRRPFKIFSEESGFAHLFRMIDSSDQVNELEPLFKIISTLSPVVAHRVTFLPEPTTTAQAVPPPSPPPPRSTPPSASIATAPPALIIPATNIGTYAPTYDASLVDPADGEELADVTSNALPSQDHWTLSQFVRLGCRAILRLAMDQPLRPSTAIEKGLVDPLLYCCSQLQACATSSRLLTPGHITRLRTAVSEAWATVAIQWFRSNKIRIRRVGVEQLGLYARHQIHNRLASAAEMTQWLEENGVYEGIFGERLDDRVVSCAGDIIKNTEPSAAMIHLILDKTDSRAVRALLVDLLMSHSASTKSLPLVLKGAAMRIKETGHRGCFAFLEAAMNPDEVRRSTVMKKGSAVEWAYIKAIWTCLRFGALINDSGSDSASSARDGTGGGMMSPTSAVSAVSSGTNHGGRNGFVGGGQREEYNVGPDKKVINALVSLLRDNAQKYRYSFMKNCLQLINTGTIDTPRRKRAKHVDTTVDPVALQDTGQSAVDESLRQPRNVIMTPPCACDGAFISSSVGAADGSAISPIVIDTGNDIVDEEEEEEDTDAEKNPEEEKPILLSAELAACKTLNKILELFPEEKQLYGLQVHMELRADVIAKLDKDWPLRDLLFQDLESTLELAMSLPGSVSLARSHGNTASINSNKGTVTNTGSVNESVSTASSHVLVVNSSGDRDAQRAEKLRHMDTRMLIRHLKAKLRLLESVCRFSGGRLTLNQHIIGRLWTLCCGGGGAVESNGSIGVPQQQLNERSVAVRETFLCWLRQCIDKRTHDVLDSQTVAYVLELFSPSSFSLTSLGTSGYFCFQSFFVKVNNDARLFDATSHEAAVEAAHIFKKQGPPVELSGAKLEGRRVRVLQNGIYHVGKVTKFVPAFHRYRISLPVVMHDTDMALLDEWHLLPSSNDATAGPVYVSATACPPQQLVGMEALWHIALHHEQDQNIGLAAAELLIVLHSCPYDPKMNGNCDDDTAASDAAFIARIFHELSTARKQVDVPELRSQATMTITRCIAILGRALFGSATVACPSSPSSPSPSPTISPAVVRPHTTCMIGHEIQLECHFVHANAAKVVRNKFMITLHSKATLRELADKLGEHITVVPADQLRFIIEPGEGADARQEGGTLKRTPISMQRLPRLANVTLEEVGLMGLNAKSVIRVLPVTVQGKKSAWNSSYPSSSVSPHKLNAMVPYTGTPGIGPSPSAQAIMGTNNNVHADDTIMGPETRPSTPTLPDGDNNTSDEVPDLPDVVEVLDTDEDLYGASEPSLPTACDSPVGGSELDDIETPSLEPVRVPRFNHSQVVQNDERFALLMGLMDSFPWTSSVCEAVWSLLQALPTNHHIRNVITSGNNPQDQEIAATLLDLSNHQGGSCASVWRVAYALGVVEACVMPPLGSSEDQKLIDWSARRASFEAAIIRFRDPILRLLCQVRDERNPQRSRHLNTYCLPSLTRLSKCIVAPLTDAGLDLRNGSLHFSHEEQQEPLTSPTITAKTESIVTVDNIAQDKSLGVIVKWEQRTSGSGLLQQAFGALPLILLEAHRSASTYKTCCNSCYAVPDTSNNNNNLGNLSPTASNQHEIGNIIAAVPRASVQLMEPAERAAVVCYSCQRDRAVTRAIVDGLQVLRGFWQQHPDQGLFALQRDEEYSAISANHNRQGGQDQGVFWHLFVSCPVALIRRAAQMLLRELAISSSETRLRIIGMLDTLERRLEQEGASTTCQDFFDLFVDFLQHHTDTAGTQIDAGKSVPDNGVSVNESTSSCWSLSSLNMLIDRLTAFILGWAERTSAGNDPVGETSLFVNSMRLLACVLSRRPKNNSASRPFFSFSSSSLSSSSSSMDWNAASAASRPSDRSIIKSLWFRFLMDTRTPKPLCESNESREAVCEVLRALAGSNAANAALVLSLSERFAKCTPVPLRRSDRGFDYTEDWAFDPGMPPSLTPGSTHIAGAATSACKLRNSTGKMGLVNRGSTCYMNAVLQQLYNASVFREAILSAPIVPSRDALAVGTGAVGGFENSITGDVAVVDADVPGLRKEVPMVVVGWRCWCSGQNDLSVNSCHLCTTQRPDVYEEIKEAVAVDAADDNNAVDGDMLMGDRESGGTTPGGSNKAEKERAARADVLREIQRAFTFMRDGVQGSFEPYALVMACKCLNLEFSVTSQNDASEFYDKLLDTLEQAVMDSPHLQKAMQECFSGRQIKLKSCKTCGTVSVSREETFNRLELIVKDNNIEKNDLLACLKAFVAPEEMEGDNRVECENCKTRTPTTFVTCLTELPEYLMVHPKRFAFNLETMETVKLNHRITFPRELDMEPFTYDGVAQSSHGTLWRSSASGGNGPITGSGVGDSEDMEAEQIPYELSGVIVHRGRAGGGHYYSMVQVSDGALGDSFGNTDDLKGQWIQFNDDRVSVFDPDSTKGGLDDECFGGRFERSTFGWTQATETVDKENNAFMLMYHRKNNNQQQQQQQQPQYDASTSTIPLATPAQRAAAASAAPASPSLLSRIFSGVVPLGVSPKNKVDVVKNDSGSDTDESMGTSDIPRFPKPTWLTPDVSPIQASRPRAATSIKVNNFDRENMFSDDTVMGGVTGPNTPIITGHLKPARKSVATETGGRYGDGGEMKRSGGMGAGQSLKENVLCGAVDSHHEWQTGRFKKMLQAEVQLVNDALRRQSLLFDGHVAGVALDAFSNVFRAEQQANKLRIQQQRSNRGDTATEEGDGEAEAGRLVGIYVDGLAFFVQVVLRSKFVGNEEKHEHSQSVNEWNKIAAQVFKNSRYGKKVAVAFLGWLVGYKSSDVSNVDNFSSTPPAITNSGHIGALNGHATETDAGEEHDELTALHDLAVRQAYFVKEESGTEIRHVGDLLADTVALNSLVLSCHSKLSFSAASRMFESALKATCTLAQEMGLEFPQPEPPTPTTVVVDDDDDDELNQDISTDTSETESGAIQSALAGVVAPTALSAPTPSASLSSALSPLSVIQAGCDRLAQQCCAVLLGQADAGSGNRGGKESADVGVRYLDMLQKISTHSLVRESLRRSEILAQLVHVYLGVESPGSGVDSNMLPAWCLDTGLSNPKVLAGIPKVIELLLERNERVDMERQLKLVAPISARMVFGVELARALRENVRKQENVNAKIVEDSANPLKHNSSNTSGYQMDNNWGSTAGGQIVSRYAAQAGGESVKVVGNIGEITALLRLLPAARSAVKRGANDLWGRDDAGGKQAISQVGVSKGFSGRSLNNPTDKDDIYGVVHPSSSDVINSSIIDRDGRRGSRHSHIDENEQDDTELMYHAAAGPGVVEGQDDNDDDDDDELYHTAGGSVGSAASNLSSMSTSATHGCSDDDEEPPPLVRVDSNDRIISTGSGLAGTGGLGSSSSSDDIEGLD